MHHCFSPISIKTLCVAKLRLSEHVIVLYLILGDMKRNSGLVCGPAGMKGQSVKVTGPDNGDSDCRAAT